MTPERTAKRENFRHGMGGILFPSRTGTEQNFTIQGDDIHICSQFSGNGEVHYGESSGTTSAEFWLGLRKEYELRKARREMEPRIGKDVVPLR